MGGAEITFIIALKQSFFFNFYLHTQKDNANLWIWNTVGRSWDPHSVGPIMGALGEDRL